MSVFAPLWIFVSGAALLAPAAWFLYEHYLHPAWRRQRRVIRACKKAFHEGDYRLVRLRVSQSEPSASDLFSAWFGSGQFPRYFTYKIETLGETEPDFSEMRKWEIGLVQHYLHRTGDMPHHGREVLYPGGNPTNERSRAPA